MFQNIFQVLRNFRKPLVVVAPKVILRLPAATSHLEEMKAGTSFLPVISDKKVKNEKVKKVVFCSGKHFYILDKERDTKKNDDVALIRLEVRCFMMIVPQNEEVVYILSLVLAPLSDIY